MAPTSANIYINTHFDSTNPDPSKIKRLLNSIPKIKLSCIWT